MKKWILFSLVSLVTSAALADGTITCKGFDASKNVTEDVLMIEADMAILLTASGDESFLSPRWSNNEIKDYANDIYVVSVDLTAKTITTEKRIDGSKKVHTEAKCRHNGIPDDEYF